MKRHRPVLSELREAMEAHVQSLTHQDAPVLGWCCSYLPVEVLEGAGIVPFRLVPEPPVDTEDAYLSPNFCPYVRAVLGEGFSGRYPFLSGLIIMNTCDGMRRLFDSTRHRHGRTFAHFMDLPRITTPSAVAYFKGEILNLVEQTAARFGTSITLENLEECIRASNRTHAFLLKIQRLMREGKSDLTGYEFIELSRAGGILPREVYNRILEDVINQSAGTGKPRGVPILLTGSMLENLEIVAMIEGYGGWVAAQDLCVSGRHPENPTPLTGDPLLNLARQYLLTPPCARMQENQRRIDRLVKLIRSCGVRGAICYVLKFCDTFLYEIPMLKRVLGSLGIPLLILESEYRSGRGGSIQTRIQAFLEMIHGSAEKEQRETGL